MQLAREEADSKNAANNLLKRKREKLEDKGRLEDLVGPKEVGREGMLEKKRAKRESDRAVRDARDDGGLEVSEDVLMGGGGSFKERSVIHIKSRSQRIPHRACLGSLSGMPPGPDLGQTKRLNEMYERRSEVSVLNRLESGIGRPWRCSSKWPKKGLDSCLNDCSYHLHLFN